MPGLLLLGLMNASSLLSATVSIRIVDVVTGKITPAMVCITDAEGNVRLPPDGRQLQSPSTTEEFYRGVEFDPDPNWIGPVRKMQGIGNNDDRSYVYELRPSIPYWQEPVQYQTSGNFSIDLPPGEWRLAVDRGLEHVPVFRTFTVTTDSPASLEIPVQRWIDLPSRGWWSGDVHVHHPIQNEAHRQFLLSYARACDLHVVNVLEMGHHAGTDFRQMGFGRDYRSHEDTYWLVAGQEEPRSTFGHIIGLNLQHLARDLPTYDFYDLAFRRIHEQRGALVGFAHFSWNGCDLPRGFPWYVTTGALDFVELLQFSQLNAMDYYDYLNLGFRLTAAAGSDTPWGSTLGEVRTYVHVGPDLNIDSWFENLRKGHTFVSNGPVLEFTVDNQLPGSELNRNKGDTVRIRARVLGHPATGRPKSLSIVGNQGVLWEQTSPGSSETQLALDETLEVDRSQWLVVSAVADNDGLAHTTPIYVKVDGRPTWCPDRGPTIVQAQLDAIERIDREFTPATDDRARGIQERLDRARVVYRRMLDEMASVAPASAETVSP